MSRPTVAVIGSGVSGLTSAYLLQRQYDVTLFEADSRLGGHAHTHDLSAADAGSLRVDSGFIVHNRVTYPNLVRLFGELGVATQSTDMSMSVRCEGCGLEYAGARGLRGVLAEPRSVARLPFLRMLTEVPRFHRHARRVVGQLDDRMTLGEFMAEGGYSPYFVSHFMIPVVSAVWSASPETSLKYPAQYLFTFLANHGMLSVKGSHQWYSMVGGSRTYVDKAAKDLHSVRLSTPVRSISRPEGASAVVVTDSGPERFDKVVVATHPDTAIDMLSDPTPEEKAALGAFAYARNETVLHSDESLLPRQHRARAAWNYLMPACDAGTDRVLVSYDMNRLQRLPTKRPFIVTLNATERIHSSTVIARMQYDHPIYTPASVAAQRDLPGLNSDHFALAGAYHGWGFHEDGCRAGVAAARALGVTW